MLIAKDIVKYIQFTAILKAKIEYYLLYNIQYVNIIEAWLDTFRSCLEVSIYTNIFGVYRSYTWKEWMNEYIIFKEGLRIEARIAST